MPTEDLMNELIERFDLFESKIQILMSELDFS